MALKTFHDLINRQTINDMIIQGGNFGSLLASVQVDQIGMQAGYYYLHKNILSIGFLGIVRYG